jgi:hypothetical protein
MTLSYATPASRPPRRAGSTRRRRCWRLQAVPRGCLPSLSSTMAWSLLTTSTYLADDGACLAGLLLGTLQGHRRPGRVEMARVGEDGGTCARRQPRREEMARVKPATVGKAAVRAGKVAN